MSVFSHPRRSFLPAWTGEALVADSLDARSTSTSRRAGSSPLSVGFCRPAKFRQKCNDVAAKGFTMTGVERAAESGSHRVGWAKRSVPTILLRDKVMVGTAQARLCPPYEPSCSFVTDLSAICPAFALPTPQRNDRHRPRR